MSLTGNTPCEGENRWRNREHSRENRKFLRRHVFVVQSLFVSCWPTPRNLHRPAMRRWSHPSPNGVRPLSFVGGNRRGVSCRDGACHGQKPFCPCSGSSFANAGQ